MNRTPLAEALKERDDARARLEEWQSTARFAHEDHPAVALIREERDSLRTQLEAVTAERDTAVERATERYWRAAYDDTCAELADAKCRIADLEAAAKAGTPTDLEERTGPVAFERNQLRDELAELRPQVNDLRAKLAAAEHRATMHERDADESSRAVTVLSTIIRASVEAIARGVK